MGFGKKLDSLLGRGFKTDKFKATLNLAVSRLAVFKNQRQARLVIARADVVELLRLGSHERALLRVEQVIKEQNMLDVYDLLDGYCHLLLERVSLFEQEKGCPDELVEAVSSLIHAASRCGDFPEIQEIRKIFTTHFGKEFTARATELRNNCRVNPKMIQKLSPRMQRTESKMKVLREIASENSIVLQFEEFQDSRAEDQKDLKAAKIDSAEFENAGAAEGFTESVNFTGKYRDVAHAAQVAFESAAYAAAAARVAVELSRSEPTDHNSTHRRSE